SVVDVVVDVDGEVVDVEVVDVEVVVVGLVGDETGGAVGLITRVGGGGVGEVVRSEEHTSELQSPYDLVCRLLLEKKKPDLIRSFLTNVTPEQLEDPPKALSEVADRLLPRLGQPIPKLNDAIAVWAGPLEGTPLHI